MTTPTPGNQANNGTTGYVPPTSLRCFTGSVISGAIATVLYGLTLSIIQTFAAKPLPTSNATAANIAVAVRTLVVGVSTLATAIFGIAALGLIALGIQLLMQRSPDQGK